MFQSMESACHTVSGAFIHRAFIEYLLRVRHVLGAGDPAVYRPLKV